MLICVICDWMESRQSPRHEFIARGHWRVGNESSLVNPEEAAFKAVVFHIFSNQTPSMGFKINRSNESCRKSNLFWGNLRQYIYINNIYWNYICTETTALRTWCSLQGWPRLAELGARATGPVSVTCEIAEALVPGKSPFLGEIIQKWRMVHFQVWLPR